MKLWLLLNTSLYVNCGIVYTQKLRKVDSRNRVERRHIQYMDRSNNNIQEEKSKSTTELKRLH